MQLQMMVPCVYWSLRMRKVELKFEKCQKLTIFRDLELGDDLDLYKRGQNFLIWPGLKSNMLIAQLARTTSGLVNRICAMPVFGSFSMYNSIPKFKMAATEPKMGRWVYKTQNPIFLSSLTNH